MNRELEFLNNNTSDNTSVVVACSGGPDSMCLLSLVDKLKTTKNITVICAHVNHKLRTESEKEAELVHRYCQENNIIFELLEITDYLNGAFSEEDARKRRYEFFKQMVTKYKAKYLLTAHHGDDLIETVLMRMTRGSNLSGYAGIRQVNTNESYQILRPLLTTTKEAILKELKIAEEMLKTCPNKSEEIQKRINIIKEFAPKIITNEDEILNIIEQLNISLIKINQGLIMKTLKTYNVDLTVANKILREKIFNE